MKKCDHSLERVLAFNIASTIDEEELKQITGGINDITKSNLSYKYTNLFKLDITVDF